MQGIGFTARTNFNQNKALYIATQLNCKKLIFYIYKKSDDRPDLVPVM